MFGVIQIIRDFMGGQKNDKKVSRMYLNGPLHNMYKVCGFQTILLYFFNCLWSLKENKKIEILYLVIL